MNILYLTGIPVMILTFISPLNAGETKYGHFQYKEAKKEDLIKAGSYPDGRPKKLIKEANYAYKKMVNAAQTDGIELVLLSAFRTKNHQKYLFKRAIKRHGSVKNAARWVAPSGYSEHHTGETVDIGDADAPKTNLNTSFADTEAYKWLVENAEDFGFYISFPKGNTQGASYEPWHWRHRDGREREKAESKSQ